MFLTTRLLAGFKIAFLSLSENPSPLSEFKKEVFAGAKCFLVAPPNYIQERHLLANVENKKKRKESASRCLNGLVPLIRGLPT